MDDRVRGPSWTGSDCFFYMVLPLIGLRATESGVDCRVLGTITVVSTLMSIASGLAVAISGFRSARFAFIVVATG